MRVQRWIKSPVHAERRLHDWQLHDEFNAGGGAGSKVRSRSELQRVADRNIWKGSLQLIEATCVELQLAAPQNSVHASIEKQGHRNGSAKWNPVFDISNNLGVSTRVNDGVAEQWHTDRSCDRLSRAAQLIGIAEADGGVRRNRDERDG